MALSLTDDILAQLELETAGRQKPAAVPKPSPYTNDYLAQAELETARPETIPIGTQRVNKVLNLDQYPMPNTSSWVSGTDAAQYLGIPYDPNALYERPWAPGEPGIPLETLFNQMIRDQQNAAANQRYAAGAELETAGREPARSFSPVPYGPGAQQAIQNPPPPIVPYSSAAVASQGPQLQTPSYRTPTAADLMRAGDLPLPRVDTRYAPVSSTGLDTIKNLNAGSRGGPDINFGNILDAENRYVSSPLIGGAVNAITSPNWKDLGALTQGPGALFMIPFNRAITDYGGSQKRGEQIRSDVYDISPGLGTAYDILTAPSTYLAPGALAKVGAKLPALKPVLAIAEGVGPGKALPLAVGAGTGTELASRFDVPGVSEPIEQLVGGLGGGIAGLGAASIRRGARGALDVPVSKAVGDGGREVPGVTMRPDIEQIPNAEIQYRPDLFQARDRDPGKAFSEARVTQIVDNYDPLQMTPGVLVRDTSTGDLVVLSGHHRVEVARRMAAIGESPDTTTWQIIDADLTDPKGVKRLQQIADQANYTTAAPNIREQVRSTRRILENGGDVVEVKGQLRQSSDAAARDLIALSSLPDDMIDELVRRGAPADLMAEIAAVAKRTEMDEGAVRSLASRYVYRTAKDRPTRTYLRQVLEEVAPAVKRAREAQLQRAQGSMFDLDAFKTTGLDNSILNEIDLMLAARKSADQKIRKLKQARAELADLADDADSQSQLTFVDDLIQRRIAQLEEELGGARARLDIDPADSIQEGGGGVRPGIEPSLEAVADSGRAGAEAPTAGADLFADPAPRLAPDLDPSIPVRPDLELAGQPPVAAAAPPAQPPRRPPALPVPPRQPSMPVPETKLLEQTPYQSADTAILQQYEGALGEAGLQLRRDTRIGNQLLKKLRMGSQDGNRYVVPRSPQSEALMRAVHSEGTVPPGLEDAVAHLRKLYADEDAAMRQFDPTFVGIEGDYASRAWREIPISEKEAMTRLNAGSQLIAEADDVVQEAATAARGSGGNFGSKPSFTKRRVDATYEELLDSVRQLDDGSYVRREPVSWNPFEMYAIRRDAGVRFRQQSVMIDRIKATNVGKTLEHGAPAPDGYRVPQVGPAFEGKPIAYKKSDAQLEARPGNEAALKFTPQIAVPTKLADRLEMTYGPRPEWNVGRLDFRKLLGAPSSWLKQAKLIGSLFQQIDYMSRSAGGAGLGGVIEQLSRGKLFDAAVTAARIPKVIVDEIWANMSPGRRADLQAQLLSDKPFFKDHPGITPRAIVAAGMTQADSSIVVRDMRQYVEGLTAGKSGAPMRLAKGLNRGMQNGLFDGVLPTAQLFALKNLILPRILAQHPKWSATQVAMQAADEANKMFSTIGGYQSVIKNSNVRAMADMAVFSANEFEAIMKQAGSVAHGPNKKLWIEYNLGFFLGAAIVAEVVNKGVTGEWLPMEDLSPLEKGDNIAGVRYNSGFLSPAVGTFARGGAQANLDLIGQMDTVFTFLTDPFGAIESRLNVLPGAIKNQWKGEDFYGRNIRTGFRGLPGRAQQLASDLGMPIGATNLAEVARQKAPGMDWLPEQEGRLGPLGTLFQSGGANLRAEPNADFRDRTAREWAEKNGVTRIDPATGEDTGEPITSWADLAPSQQKALQAGETDFTDEMERRKATSVLRGDEFAVASEEDRTFREAARTEYASRQAALDSQFQAEGDGEAWRAQRKENLTELSAKLEQISAGNEYPAKAESDLIQRYYDAVSAGDQADGSWDGAPLERFRASLTPAQAKFLEDNAGLSRTLTPTEQAYKAAVGRIDASGYWDLRDQVVGRLIDTPILASLGLPPTVTTADDLEAAVAQKIGAVLSEHGYDPTSAEGKILQAQLRGEMLKPYDDIMGELLKGMRLSHPELLRDLVDWGYYDGSMEALAVLLGATR